MFGSFYYTQLAGVPGMVKTFSIDSNTNYYKERLNAASFSLKHFKDSPSLHACHQDENEICYSLRRM